MVERVQERVDDARVEGEREREGDDVKGRRLGGGAVNTVNRLSQFSHWLSFYFKR